MRIDYHTHHWRCGHAVGQLEEYVLSAIEKGIEQLGLSDHMPLIHVNPDEYLPEMAMAMEELPRYVEECFLLKEKYKKDIDIRVGIEADYIEHYEETIKQLLDRFEWDYIIGSVHFLGTWDITDFRQVDGWKQKDPDEVYRQYYDAVQKAVRTGFYDIVGHVDVIKRFGIKPNGDPSELERATLRAIKQADIAIELNTSGLRTPAAEMFPSKRMLQYALELGIPLTLGSDAHKPEDVGQQLEEGKKYLRQLGFEQIATFEGRRRSMRDLR